MKGKLILVVGPSGVGKDTLIDGARAKFAGDARFHFARRVITRPADAGGEDHEAVTETEFERRMAAGEFFVTWQAHGLSYGIPAKIIGQLEAGCNVFLNTSRRQIADIAKRYDDVHVISIDAPPEVVEQRLRARGREEEADILSRRERTAPPPVDGVLYTTLMNGGTVDEGIARFIATILGAATLPCKLKRATFEVWREAFCLLHVDNPVVAAASLSDAAMVEICAAAGHSARARLALTSDRALVAEDEAALSTLAFERLAAHVGALVTIQRSPSPKSRDVLRKKVGGAELTEDDLRLVTRDLVEGRYSSAETAGFLVAASKALSFDEIVALTRVRAEYMERLSWDAERVVDKHSMGGIPGSRITLIVVPIVAAHGLTIPKTSSRAITSAAGTADAMEALAKVDLTHAEMRDVVARCGGCIAWNGRINHSPVDDVMNAINRSLGVSSQLLDVTSILSKKIAAGSSHVLLDIPFGPGAKLKSFPEAQRLAQLFERVGRAVGLDVAARPSDGRAPVGRGVGPALEVRDVLAVLNGDASAPKDLRAKAVRFAATILAWDPALSEGAASARAEELLQSGAAREAFQRIIEAQDRNVVESRPGYYERTVNAQRSGTLVSFDGFVISGIARAAGAPSDKSAGVDILENVGANLKAGQPVLRVHASREEALQRAWIEERPEAAFLVA